MKRCPQCKRTYADDTLSFCLEDGGLLSAPYNEEETVSFSKDYLSSKIDPDFRADKSVATVIARSPITSPSQVIEAPSKDRGVTRHLIYALAGLVAILILGIAWLAISSSKGNESSSTTTAKPVATVAAAKPAKSASPEPSRAVTASAPNSVAVTGSPNCVVSYSSGSCWTIKKPTTPSCSNFTSLESKVDIQADGKSAEIIVSSTSDNGVRAVDPSGNEFRVDAGDQFEINVSGQSNFSRDHGCGSPEGLSGWYDPYVDSPFKQNVGGLEFSIGGLNENRFFAGRQFSGIAATSGVPTFRVIDRPDGSDTRVGKFGGFTVRIRKDR